MTQNPYEAASISLVGISEIHDLLLSVSRERVMQLTCTGDFPEAIAELVGGEVWLREDVEAWIADHSAAVADVFKVGR